MTPAPARRSLQKGPPRREDLRQAPCLGCSLMRAIMQYVMPRQNKGSSSLPVERRR